MKVDSSSQLQATEVAQASTGQEQKSYWQSPFGTYFGQDAKVEGFSDSDDEPEAECREDALDGTLASSSESSNSRDVLGASISNSFDSIVNAPSEENEQYLNDAKPSCGEREGASSLSLSVSSSENHLEQKLSETRMETVLTEESDHMASVVKATSTVETNESENSSATRESARSAASMFDDDSDNDSVEDEDDCDNVIEIAAEADEAKIVKRRSRIEELKEQLGLTESQVSASASEESDSSHPESVLDAINEMTSPAPTMDSAYDGELEISKSATGDSVSLNQEPSSGETSSSAWIPSILVKSNSDEKKKKNPERRVQFDMSSVEEPAPQPTEPEPKSLWDLLDNLLVNTDLGILDRSCKEEKPSRPKVNRKALMDDMAKEVESGPLVASSAASQNSESSGRLANQFPVVDFKQIDRLIAASQRYPNRLPSIPECAEPSFDIPGCDNQSLTEEERRMGLSALADMSVTSMSESVAENSIAETAFAEEREKETESTEATEQEKKSFFNSWNCGNLKCVTPETKDMCGPTMKLPGMIALQAMNDIPITNESMLHWTDSEQQNESISRSILMANEHVNGTKAYLSMIDGVDSDDEDTIGSENTSQTSNVYDDFEHSAISDPPIDAPTDAPTDCRSENPADAPTDTPTDADQKREREEPSGCSPIQDAPSAPKESISKNQEEVSCRREEPSDPSSTVEKNASSSANESISENEEESSSPTIRKRMDPPTSPKPTQQATADMEMSTAHKARQLAQKAMREAEQRRRARKPDPESFEASRPKTKPPKNNTTKSKEKNRQEQAKKNTVAKSKKMDPTESKPNSSKPTQAKKPMKKLKKDPTESKSKSAVKKMTKPKTNLTDSKATMTKETTAISKARRAKPTPEVAQIANNKKATMQSKTARAYPTPESTKATTTKTESTPGSNQACPIVLVEEPAQETRDDSSPVDDNASQVLRDNGNVDSPTVEQPSSAMLSPINTTRQTSKLQKREAERQQLKDTILSEMPPLYALKPDEIALVLDVGTREYLSDRRSYNLAYEQARWCVLAAQSNTDRPLTSDMTNEIIRDECQRFRE
ncbi:unnamed protein product [Cylindrotheca closterium]|uniref:Uncharacterized protein n=1 Tax=Cylindrotheca closterium TaxID=2856 RepID=A0AAD2JMC4_9STRA|nr:unnamed protein product [Cylindrotheca closterium]